MREMHKWKDKVSFSLDNRQIFFLFFGLSVVGCFVFALGVMVGKKVSWEPGSEVAALTGDSLAMLESDGPADTDGEFTFKDGLREPATIGLPQTKKEAERQAADDAATAEAKSPGDQLAHSAPATPPKQDGDTVMASAVKAPAKATKGRVFTLQMKAFSRREEADKFADRLRRNGHAVRVEEHEVRGRMWHRVRLGEFHGWEQALAAKSEFERAEHVIAYVVRD